jgi:hypothetical protein
LLRPVKDVLELQILTETTTVVVNNLFDSVGLEVYSPVSGFERGSGFRTAGVLISQWAGTGERLRIRIILKGRGPLPAFIPGMDRYDHNPIGLGKNGGTGVFLDNFRLSNGYDAALPPLDPSIVTITSDSTHATFTSVADTMAPSCRVYVWSMETGRLTTADVDANGRFVLVTPFSPSVQTAHFLVSYGTSAAGGTGRLFSPQVKMSVSR